MELITEQLIEETYMFCYKRLNNPSDAEDLAQDILLEAFKAIRSGKVIYSFNSYFWKLAHNRYAALINRRNKLPTTIPLESTAVIEQFDYDTMLDGLIFDETAKEIHYAISRLSRLHREVLIEYYLKGNKIENIAENLNVPVGTIKRRLFDAKHTVKERICSMPKISFLSYAPSEIEIWHRGRLDFPPLADDLLTRQLVVCCANEAKTVAQLSEELSVAPVYIEDKIAQLISADLMKETVRDRYITDFIIVHKNSVIAMLEELDKLWAVVGDFMGKKIAELWKEISGLDFYGVQFGREYLNWVLFYLAAGSFGQKLIEKWQTTDNFKSYSGYSKPFRVMGQVTYADEKMYDYEPHSVYWWSHWSKIETLDQCKFMYANAYNEKPFDKDRSYFIDGFSIPLIIRLTVSPNPILKPKEEEQLAFFIEKGIVKKTSNGYEPQLMIISTNKYKQLQNIFDREFADIAEHYAELAPKIIDKFLLSEIRGDLLEQYYNYLAQIFLEPTTHMLWCGIHSGQMQIPQDHLKSAAGLFIIAEHETEWYSEKEKGNNAETSAEK